MYTSAILIASTKGAAGEREDTSGPQLKKRLLADNFEVRYISILPDEIDAISEQIREWIDEEKIDLVLTSGGTGLTPNDITPEATRILLEREVPGLAEAIRAAGRPKTPHADLSRGLAGIRQQSLVINLPGSPRGALEGLETVIAALPHALDKIKGDPTDCA